MTRSPIIVAETYVADDRRKTCLLHLEGEFDIASAEDLRAQLIESLRIHENLIIDLSAASFVDSTILGVLVEAARRTSGWLRIVDPQSTVLRVLQVTKLDAVFGVYSSAAAAAAAQARSGHKSDSVPA